MEICIAAGRGNGIHGSLNICRFQRLLSLKFHVNPSPLFVTSFLLHSNQKTPVFPVGCILQNSCNLLGHFNRHRLLVLVLILFTKLIIIIHTYFRLSGPFLQLENVRRNCPKEGVQEGNTLLLFSLLHENAALLKRLSYIFQEIDSDSCRRRRGDMTMEIRKQKREEGLAKRRICNTEEASPFGAATGPSGMMSIGTLPQPSPATKQAPPRVEDIPRYD